MPTLSAPRLRTGAKRLSQILVAVSLAAGLAACGSSATPPATQETAAGNAFPVSIKHKYGTTEVKAKPARVVTLGLSDQDAVLALGVVPVGAIDWFGERPYGKWPWVSQLWGSTPPEIVGEREEFKYEKIIALKPDLIIGLYTGLKEEQYKTLAAIAPTVAQSGDVDDYAMPWQEMTRITGKALGQLPKAEELITGIAARFADIKKANPGWAGKTVAVVDPYEPGKYAAFAPHDPKVVFLKEMGFKESQAITDLAGAEYAAEITSERLDIVEVDRLVFLTSVAEAEATVKADPVYTRLKVAQENRALFVPYEEPPIGAALSFMTVLSIPYALEKFVPLLQAIK